MEPSFALPLADMAARSRLSRADSALPDVPVPAVQAAAAHLVLACQGCTYVRAVTPRVTLQTIADRLGVSRMTVSNVFSRPDQLSEELRLQVLLAAEELGYVGPDPTARGARAVDDGSDRRAAHRCALLRLQRRGLDDLPGRPRRRAVPTGMAVTLLTSNDRDDFVRPVTWPSMVAHRLTLLRPRRPGHGLVRRSFRPRTWIRQPVAGARDVNVDDEAALAAGRARDRSRPSRRSASSTTRFRRSAS